MASQGYKGLLIGFGSPRSAGSLEQKRQTSPRKLLVQRTKIENLHECKLVRMRLNVGDREGR
jgi:hypothetical protein